MADNNAGQLDSLIRKMNATTSAALRDPLGEKTIFRVPAFVRESHKELFEPKMVSIGPYHYHKESLRSMEKHKWSFLQSFLRRTNGVQLDEYIRATREIAPEASECYSEDFNIQGDKFVMMLILDGCFILEHLLRLSNIEERNSAYCKTGWGLSALKTDLVLLENQIPFFVLHKLYEIYFVKKEARPMNCREGHCPLQDLFFEHSVCSSFIIMHNNNERRPRVECEYIEHYLHLVNICMVSDDQTLRELRLSMEEAQEGETTVIPCASELYEAGITFKCSNEPRDMFDITFRNGTMEIPIMSIDCDKKIIFSNIVAFEQTQVMSNNNVPPTLMNYLSLMDALVNTEKDVNLLVKKGILQNMMPDEENVAAFFNDLGDSFVPVKYKRHHFSTDINRYRARRLPTLRARLRPLCTMSVIAVGVLLVASILQSTFTGVQTFE